jgi:glyoxylase-like metal-dependent hydrolase (beta-lactamase superfamily II)
MKLTDRVYLVGSGAFGLNLTDDYDCHVYLVDGGSEAALIDGGGGRDTSAITRIIEDDGIPLDRVRYLLLTHGHADHAAGAALLREALGLQVLASPDIANALQKGGGRGIALDLAKEAGMYPEDFSFQPCPVDGELKEGQKVVVGDCELLVMETPGHSMGHLSFLMDSEGVQYLFSGDAVLWGGRIVLLSSPDSDLQAYIRTIKKLSGFSVDVFLPGHQCFSLRDGQRHLDTAMAALKAMSVPPNLK